MSSVSDKVFPSLSLTILLIVKLPFSSVGTSIPCFVFVIVNDNLVETFVYVPSPLSVTLYAFSLSNHVYIVLPLLSTLLSI